MTYDGMMRLPHEDPQPNEPRVDTMQAGVIAGD